MKLELPCFTSLVNPGKRCSGSRACLLIPRTGFKVWFKKWDRLDLNPAWLGQVMVISYLLDLYGDKWDCGPT